jgi:hypothetical protein
MYAGACETFDHKVRELEERLQKNNKDYEKSVAKCAELQQLVDSRKGVYLHAYMLV